MGRKTPNCKLDPTQTEAQFKAKLKNNMRRITMYWKPIQNVLKKAERKVAIGFFGNGNTKFKTEHQCANCLIWFEKERNKKGTLTPAVKVDHKRPIGGWSKDFDKWPEDLSSMYERALVTEEGLWCLCRACHDKKSKEEKVSGAWVR